MPKLLVTLPPFALPLVRLLQHCTRRSTQNSSYVVIYIVAQTLSKGFCPPSLVLGQRGDEREFVLRLTMIPVLTQVKIAMPLQILYSSFGHTRVSFCHLEKRESDHRIVEPQMRTPFAASATRQKPHRAVAPTTAPRRVAHSRPRSPAMAGSSTARARTRSQ